MLTRRFWPTPIGLGLKLRYALVSMVYWGVTPAGNGLRTGMPSTPVLGEPPICTTPEAALAVGDIAMSVEAINRKITSPMIAFFLKFFVFIFFTFVF